MKRGNLPLFLALRVHNFDNTSLSFCMIRYNIRLGWKKKGNDEILSLEWYSQTCWINDLMAMKTQLEGLPVMALLLSLFLLLEKAIFSSEMSIATLFILLLYLL